jgi:hypothetical protein
MRPVGRIFPQQAAFPPPVEPGSQNSASPSAGCTALKNLRLSGPARGRGRRPWLRRGAPFITLYAPSTSVRRPGSRVAIWKAACRRVRQLVLLRIAGATSADSTLRSCCTASYQGAWAGATPGRSTERLLHPRSGAVERQRDLCWSARLLEEHGIGEIVGWCEEGRGKGRDIRGEWPKW